MHKIRGWGLIELVAVVAIIGILMGIVYPNLQNYLTNSRRSEGVVLLLEIMQQQERYFTDNLTYTNDFRNLGYEYSSYVLSSGGLYRVESEICGSLSYDLCIKLRATPQGIQAGSGDITLDSRGVREGIWR